MNGTGKIIAVVAVVAVVAVAAVFASGILDDDKGDDHPTYYFYLDGMGDEVNGWYSSEGPDAPTALGVALTKAGVAYDLGDEGWINHIDDNFSTYDSVNNTGVGYSVLGYRSTDLTSPYDGYFTAGGGLGYEVCNVLYISYGGYNMDSVSYQFVYDVAPYYGHNLFTSGPFADYEEYKPLKIPSSYYFFLDGMGDEVNGWYSATGTDAATALHTALTNENIDHAIGEDGWITHIDENVSSYDSLNNTGVGYSVLGYRSTDLTSPYDGYFTAGGGLGYEVCNILYISYGGYNMDPVSYLTVYDVAPYYGHNLFLTGPFASSA